MSVAVPPTKIPSAPADASLAPLANAINRTYINRMNEPPEELNGIFKRYAQELQFICATHTPSHLPEARLTEEEVVMGTILTPCSQKKWRKSRVHNMNVHVSGLVHDIRREILPSNTCSLQKASSSEVTESLRRAQTVWELSVREENTFGGNSFGLIALGIIFDCMDILNQQES
jgi:RNA-dependent RNA polymerase